MCFLGQVNPLRNNLVNEAEIFNLQSLSSRLPVEYSFLCERKKRAY